MKKIFLLSCVSILFTFCKAQIVDTRNDKCNCDYKPNYKTFFCDTADISPSYTGEIASLFKFINENTDSSIILRPLKMTTANFIIVSDGKIDSLKIEDKIEEQYTISEKQLLSAIKKSEENWVAGECDGKKVAVRYKLQFRISTR